MQPSSFYQARRRSPALRLTPQQESLSQEQLATAQADQEAEYQDLIQSEQRKQAAHQREIESAASKAETARKAQLAAQKRAGIETQFDADGREDIKRHEDGQPMFKAGFIGKPAPDSEGRHSATFRDTRGGRFSVPLDAIERTTDPAGQSFYEFDLAGPDGTKQRIRRPESASNPLFKVDPATGRRYSEVQDPATGGFVQQPLGIDPKAANAAQVNRKKADYDKQKQARTFESQNLDLERTTLATNFEPVRERFTAAERAAKKLTTGRRYEQGPDGLYSVDRFNGEDLRNPIGSNDAAEIARANTWLANKKAVDSELEAARAEHDPAKQKLFELEQRKNSLAAQALAESQRHQTELADMEEAGRAGLPLFKPGWKQTLDIARKDPRYQQIVAAGEYADGGQAALADAVNNAVTRYNAAQEAKAPSNYVEAPPTSAVQKILSTLDRVSPKANYVEQNAPVDGAEVLREAETRNVLETLTGGLSAGKPAPEAKDAATAKAIALKSLGMADPEKWSLSPSSMGDFNLHHADYDADMGPIGRLDPDNKRILLFPSAAQTEAGRSMIAKAERDGFPVYHMGGGNPMSPQELRDYVAGAVNIARGAGTPEEKDAALEQGGFTLADVREKVMSGRMSVQDGKWLQEKLFETKETDSTREGWQKAFGAHLAANPLQAQIMAKGTPEERANVVNRFSDTQAGQAAGGNIFLSRDELASRRFELMEQFAGKGTGAKFMNFAKETLVPMAALLHQGAEHITGFHALKTALGSEAGALSYQQGNEWFQRIPGYLNRVSKDGAVDSALDEFRQWADKARPGDKPPDEMADALAQKLFTSYHQLTEEEAKEQGTTADTFNINKDPLLSAALQRYLNTSDPAAFEQMKRLAVMTARDRATAARVSQYVERPRAATPADVADRAEALGLSLPPAAMGAVLDLGNLYAKAKTESEAVAVLDKAQKALGTTTRDDTALALSALTTQASDDPHSITGLYRSGYSAGYHEMALEVASTAVTGGAALATTAARKVGQAAVKQAVRNAATRSLLAHAEESQLLAATRSAITRARGAVRKGAAELEESFANLGIAKPKFGQPLTKAQRLSNRLVNTAKVTAASAPGEAFEEGAASIGEPGPSLESTVEQALVGAAGAGLISPMFVGAATAADMLGSRRAGREMAKQKADWVEKFNERMAKEPGFKPISVADFDIWQGLQDNPAHQEAVAAYAGAIGELQVATEAFPVAADGAKPPAVLAAEAKVEAATQNLAGLSEMAFAAADELRALPENERALYTGAAKAAAGARDFTEAEAKALISQSGGNAVAFQQAETLPPDIQGPRNLKTLADLPDVSQVAPAVYRLPEGVQISLPPALLDTLKQAAPSMVGLMASQPVVQNAPQQPKTKKETSPNVPNQTPPVPPQQGGGQAVPQRGSVPVLPGQPDAQAPQAGAKGQPVAPNAPPDRRRKISLGAHGQRDVEFATTTDTDAFTFLSTLKKLNNPKGNLTAQQRKDAADSLKGIVARVGKATGLSESQLRALLPEYNKAVVEQSRGVAEGEKFTAQSFADFAKSRLAAEQPPSGIENLARRVISDTIAKSPKIKALLRESKKASKQASGGMWIDNDGRIAFHLPTVAKQITTLNLDPQTAAKRIAAVLDEEIRHAANIEAARRLWKSGATNPMRIAFADWRDAWYGDIWDNHFTEEMRARVIEAYGNTLPEDKWIRAMEGLRMLDQLRATGSITEAVLRHLEAVLEVLREFLTAATPTIKREIENIRAVLEEYGYEGGEVKPQKARRQTVKPKEKADAKEIKTPKSSTQFTLKPSDAKPIIDFANSIPDSELAADVPAAAGNAREDEPHVTVLYGLTEHNAEPVKKAIANHGPVTVTLGKLSIFDNPEYDVLKVEVEGESLRALNAKIAKLPNENSFPDYKPHMTIAYLKKGEGAKYVGDNRFEGKEITFDTMTFSPPKEMRGEIGRPELELTAKVQPESKKEAVSETKAPEASVDNMPGDNDPKEIPPQTPEEQPDTQRPPSGSGASAESLAKIRGAFDGLASAPASANAPFYSQLARVIETKMPNRADVATIKGILSNPQNRVKAEELKWSGILPWLKGKEQGAGGMVTKQQVLDYLANEGAVMFEGVRLGKVTPDIREVKPGIFGFFVDGKRMFAGPKSEAEAQAAKWYSTRGYDQRDSSKFAQYQLPGGENYREVVLALPVKMTGAAGMTVDAVARALGYSGWHSSLTDEQKAHVEREWAAQPYYPSDAFGRPTIYPTSPPYKSSHFPDVPNYVAHMRLNDRVDAEGQPGTFIEEIQSDRHQAAREKGYRGEVGVLPMGATMQQIEEATKGIPDAPFRTTWPLQMFKRALADAVAAGKQWIGWTTGETQAERYDLSKQVSNIRAEHIHEASGVYFIDIKLADGQNMNLEVEDGNVREGDHGTTGKPLADVIGKELAERVLSVPQGEIKNFAGLDLKVGGEGMKGFYDDILPKEVGKYVKQWGAKVEKGGINPRQIESPGGLGYMITDADGEGQSQMFDDRWKAEKWLRENPHTPIWRVDITPAMAAGVESGQALFSAPASIQSGLPKERRAAFLDVAESLIADGVNTPQALAAALMEARPDGSLQKYSQALWNFFGTIDPALTGQHDWTAIYAESAKPAAKKSKRQRLGKNPNGRGSADILDHLSENKIAIPPKQYRAGRGEYNWMEQGRISRYYLKFISAPVDNPIGANTPDVAAQTAYDKGLIGSPDADTLIAAIEEAIAGRRLMRAQLKRGERYEKELVEQRERFNADKADGGTPLDLNQVHSGDQIVLNGETLEVLNVEYDEDGYTTSVTLRDGSKYGVQSIAAGEIMLVDEFIPRQRAAADDLNLEAESEDEIKAREEAERQKRKLQEKQNERLTGGAGEYGTADMFDTTAGPMALFNQPLAKPPESGKISANDGSSSSNLELDQRGGDVADERGPDRIQSRPGTTGADGGSLDETRTGIRDTGESGGTPSDLPAALGGSTGNPVVRQPEESRTGSSPAGDAGRPRGSVNHAIGVEADRPGGITSGEAINIPAGTRAVGAGGEVGAGVAAGSPLTPEQANDVDFIERRLAAKPGVLLTNGTGTGKTFSGLGAVKRLLDAGKKHILIVAPSDKVVNDWIKTAREFFGINDVEQLADTKSNGRSSRVVVTTYANMGQNSSLVARPWDAVVTDEAHYLSQSKDGTRTEALDVLRALTLHRNGGFRYADMSLPADVERLREISAIKPTQRTDAQSDEMDAIRRKLEAKRAEFDARHNATKEAERPKVIMLSATPFAHHFSLDYAEGYLYDYPPENTRTVGRYNHPSPRSQFYIENLGYRMRTGNLTQPENATATGILERRLAERFMRDGAMSGRALQVDKDYGRHFVMTESELGTKIDEIVSAINSNDYLRPLAKYIGIGDFLERRYLLEALKARESVARIKKHLALGRKVVVFHDYKKGGSTNPLYTNFAQGQSESAYVDGKPVNINLADALDALKRAVPHFDETAARLNGLLSPLQLLQREFSAIGIFNGDVPARKRREVVDAFNKSGGDVNVILVQRASGKEGISLHDRDAKHQRVFIDLGIPSRPTDAIQSEGRIYRHGVMSDAIIEYLTTGTNFERWTFAQTIAQRASTAENLAMGERARALLQSFATGYNEAEPMEPGSHQGKGGKEKDAATLNADPFKDAVALYYTNQKKTTRNRSSEGIDYYATPEPLGFKMVEWAGIRPGEKVLEPSAGHGAIARFFPDSTNRHAVEPSNELAGRLALNATDVQIHESRFEDYHIGNKFNAIVMNPPFGMAGKTAMDHLIKAAGHLRNGGRIVALIPEGSSMEKRFEKWMDSENAAGIYMVAEYGLPPSAFERAGTSVKARVVILDKTDAPESIGGKSRSRRDFGGETPAQFFEEIKNATAPDRAEVAKLEAPEQTAETEAAPMTRDTVFPVASIAAPNTFSPADAFHAKKGKPIYVAKIERRLTSEEYAAAKALATKHSGYYSAFRGAGAVPGFQFDEIADRDAFLSAITRKDEGGEALSSAPAMPRNRAEKIVRNLGKVKAVRELNPVEARDYEAAQATLASAPAPGSGSGMASDSGAAQANEPSPGGLSEAEAIPKPRIPVKMLQELLQDIDGYGPIDADDRYRIEVFADWIAKLKANRISAVDAYHVSDAPLDDFTGAGIQTSSVDYIGRNSGNRRSESVYLFLDPDDIELGYDGILGAKQPVNTVLHLELPLDQIHNLRWDSNFNITFGTYSGVRLVDIVPPDWIKGSYLFVSPAERKRKRAAAVSSDGSLSKQSARSFQSEPEGDDRITQQLASPVNPESSGAAERALHSAPAPAPKDPQAEALRAALDSMQPLWREVIESVVQNGEGLEAFAARKRIGLPAAANILRYASGRLDVLMAAHNKTLKPKVQVEGGQVKAATGRPDLAFSGNPLMAAIDQNRPAEVVTHEEMNGAAEAMFTADPVAAEKLVVRWMDSGTVVIERDTMPDAIRAILDEAQGRKAVEMLMTAAAKLLLTEKALSGGDLIQQARLAHLYRETGTEQARALGMRYDPHATPEERAAMYLQEALVTPPDSIRKQIKDNPANKDRLLAEWAARAEALKKQLAAQGFDLDATFAEYRREQKAAAATIPQEVRVPLSRAPGRTRKLVKAVLEGKTWGEAANEAGLSFEAARKAYNAFRESINEAGVKAAQMAKDALLRSAPASDFAAQLGLPEWLEHASPDYAPVKTAATEALKKERARPKKPGAINLKNPVEVARAQNEISKAKSTYFDALSEFWRASILSGPQTHVVNFVSAALYGTYEAALKKTGTAVMADIARMFGMKPDAASLADLPAMLSATMPALKQAFADGWRSLKTDTRTFETYARGPQPDGSSFKGDVYQPALGGLLGKVMRGISFRAMTAADELVKSFFTRIEVAAQARQIARAEGLSGKSMADRIAQLMQPGSTAWIRALDHAHRITFQTELKTNNRAIDQIDGLANAISRAKKGDFGALPKGISHFIFPFVATPANIFKTGITMSPLGALLSVIDAARAYDQRRKGNEQEAARIYNAARLLDDLANQIVAWGALYALSELVRPGEDDDELPFVTGTMPWRSTAKGERDLAYRTAPPQSIRIGDKWYSYRRLDPFASALALMVDGIRAMQTDQPLEEAWADIGVRVLTNMQDKTFLQGISDLMNAVQDPQRYGSRWATNIATGFVPNLIRQPIRSADPYIRESDLPDDMGFWNALAHRVGYGIIPQAAMPRMDVWGNPTAKDTGTGGPATDFLLRLLSPVDARDASQPDPLDVALLRYNLTHEDNQFTATAPRREIQRTRGGAVVKFSLKDAEYEEMARNAGQAARRALGSNYNHDLDEAEVKRIKGIVEKFHEIAVESAFRRKLAELAGR